MPLVTPRIVFAGTSPFAVPILQALFDAGYLLVGVVTQPDKPGGRGQTLQSSPVKRRALELQLPVHQPTTLKDEAARTLFMGLAPDLLVVVAYGKILPGWLIALPRYGAVNVHGSLLPQYRGAAPIQWAMANGEKETGVCTMQIDEGLDTGPVYECARTAIGPEDTVEELSSRLAQMGADLIRKTIAGLLKGTLRPSPQDNARASYAPMLRKEDGFVDWTMPTGTIHNRIRAFRPWPGATADFRGQTCRILKSRTGGRALEKAAPGTLLIGARPHRLPSVICGDGLLLELLEVQLPNRKPQSGSDFVNGMRVEAGEKFTARTPADG